MGIARPARASPRVAKRGPKGDPKSPPRDDPSGAKDTPGSARKGVRKGAPIHRQGPSPDDRPEPETLPEALARASKRRPNPIAKHARDAATRSGPPRAVADRCEPSRSGAASLGVAKRGASRPALKALPACCDALPRRVALQRVWTSRSVARPDRRSMRHRRAATSRSGAPGAVAKRVPCPNVFRML